MKTGLVLVDIQNDYFPGGILELPGMERAAEHAKELLDNFRSEGMPCFHVQHFSTYPGSTFFLPDTEGVKIHDMVKPLASENVIDKHFPNSFRATCLRDLLFEKEVVQLVICGAMSHMCIDSTVRAAFDIGFPCIVAEDACTTRDLDFRGEIIPAAHVHSSFMTALDGTFAKVLSTEDTLKELR